MVTRTRGNPLAETTNPAEMPDFAAQPFEVRRPAKQTVPFVFNSPHSGAFYPERFLASSQLDRWQIRRSEDCLVDRLYEGVVDMGAPLLAAHFPRAFLDVNRAPDELDPTLFSGPLPLATNPMSPRVVGGLGLIPRIVGEGKPIYAGKLPAREAIERISTCYIPYHRQLRELIDETLATFGICILIDCHSMPGSITHPEGGFCPDFIIGDRFGQSASAVLSETALNRLAMRGHRVSRNRPYAGGFITEHYGKPASGVHAIQIEISRRLYLDESRFVPHRGFEAARADVMALVEALVALPPECFSGLAVAAE